MKNQIRRIRGKVRTVADIEQRLAGCCLEEIAKTRFDGGTEFDKLELRLYGHRNELAR
jgi:hypothetical protein